MQSIEVDDQTYGPPAQIPWYPNGLAWQIDAPKRVVRKSEPYKVFQRFLVGETDVVRCFRDTQAGAEVQGNLSRQEAVSMIPPLFLDVRPEHKCLDMCAAPGSKVRDDHTQQMICSTYRLRKSSKPSTHTIPNLPDCSLPMTATTNGRTCWYIKQAACRARVLR